MIPARTVDTNDRPRTAPARATACASADSRAIRMQGGVLERLRDRRVEHGSAVSEPVPTECAAGVPRRGAVRRRCGRRRRRRRHAAPAGPSRGLASSSAPSRRGSSARADLFRDPLGDEPGSPFAEHRAAESPRCRDTHRRGTRAAHGSGGTARVSVSRLRSSAHWRSSKIRTVGPAGSTDEIDDLHHEVTAAGDLRSFRRDLGDAQEVTAHRLEGRISAHRPTEVEQRRRENVAVLGSELTARDPKSALTCKLSDRPKEARLADPGLARHEQQLPVARMDLLESPLGDRDHVVPTDDHRREQRLRLRHGGSLRGDDTRFIGRSTDAVPVVEGGRVTPAREAGRAGGVSRERTAARCRHDPVDALPISHA